MRNIYDNLEVSTASFDRVYNRSDANPKSNETGYESFRLEALVWSCYMEPGKYKRLLSPEQWELVESRFPHCQHFLENREVFHKEWEERRAQKDAEIKAMWDARTEEQLQEWRKNPYFREIESWSIRDGKGPYPAGHVEAPAGAK
jgi:hypothetical protein